MTTPTDPRVEAAARVLFLAATKWDCDFDDLGDVPKRQLLVDAQIILEAADEAAWQPIEIAPKNQRLKLSWRGKDGKWRFEFGMASWDWKLGDYRSGVSRHHAATHWRPLPTPPETP